MTNGEFARTDKVFRKACSLVIIGHNADGPVSLLPSTRQASKWRNGKGIALTKKAEAIRVLQQDKYPASFNQPPGSAPGGGGGENYGTATLPH